MFIFVSIMHMIDCIAAPDEVSSKDYVSVRKSIKYVMLYILKNICVTLLDILIKKNLLGRMLKYAKIR